MAIRREHYERNRDAELRKTAVYQSANRDRAREWKRDYEQRNRTKIKNDKRNYAANNRAKILAHGRVRDALRSGKLVRRPCEVCGLLDAQAHHDDYSKPLDVRWLCSLHHNQHHAKERQNVDPTCTAAATSPAAAEAATV